MSRVAVTKYLKPRAGTRIRHLGECPHTQVQSKTFRNGSVIDNSENSICTGSGILDAKDSWVWDIGQHGDLVEGSAAPAKYIPVRIVHANDLVRKPDTELLLIGKDSDQRVVLRDSEF